jgi:transcriptional regulator with XRE-family HTH domain
MVGSKAIPEQPSERRMRTSSVDRHVGNHILERRTTLGLSLQQFSVLIGVTYQQAHKYERGHNRISAGRLYEIAKALAVPVSWFYEGLDEDRPASDTSGRLRMSLELARNFAAITNEKHQEALTHMARVLAHQSLAAAEESATPAALARDDNGNRAFATTL